MGTGKTTSGVASCRLARRFAFFSPHREKEIADFLPHVAEPRPFALSNCLCLFDFCPIPFYAEPSVVATHRHDPWHPNIDFANKRGKQRVTGSRDYYPTAASHLLDIRIDVLPR